jgi:hypothetical protein
MTYENFKALVVGHSLVWFFRETAVSYEFETYEGPLIFRCTIYKAAYSVTGWTQGADDARVADFEADYKASSTDIT